MEYAANAKTGIHKIDGQIYPINKFSFDRIIKVNSIPDDCKYCEPNIENNFPEYWMHPKQELQLVEENRLDKWRMSVLSFEQNEFMRVSVEMHPNKPLFFYSKIPNTVSNNLLSLQENLLL